MGMFKGLSSVFGKGDRAALDLSHDLPVTSSKHNTGLIMAALRTLGLANGTRSPHRSKIFSSPDAAPRPGKNSGR